MGGLPTYVGTNLSSSIRQVKARIADLTARAEKPVEEWTVGGVKIDTAENRVRMHFPGKPGEDVRRALKGAGFRWSPTVGVWQAFQSAHARASAERIAAMVST